MSEVIADSTFFPFADLIREFLNGLFLETKLSSTSFRDCSALEARQDEESLSTNFIKLCGSIDLDLQNENARCKRRLRQRK